jgi:hypothetical protein
MKSSGVGVKGLRAATKAAAAGLLLLLPLVVCVTGHCVTTRAAAGAARAQGAASGAEQLPALLAYDGRTPPDVKVVGTEARDGVTVEDVTFKGPGGTPVEAYVARTTVTRRAKTSSSSTSPRRPRSVWRPTPPTTRWTPRPSGATGPSGWPSV